VRNVEVTPLSDSELQVSWNHPKFTYRKIPIDNYVINITRLGAFDPLLNEEQFNASAAANNSEEVIVPKAMQIKVNDIGHTWVRL
jgi:hypothetical protein